MNYQEWAQKITGREYSMPTRHEEDEQAKADDVIIVYGASDDLLEFYGAISDEVGAWEGTTIKLTKDVTLFNKDENKETAKYNSMQISTMPKVQAIWCPRDKEGKIWASWEIRTELPHADFDIMEDGELFCRGVVIPANAVRYW